MIFKINIKKLAICILIPLIAGGLSTLIVGSDMKIYSSIERPPLSPPGIVFPIVWSILYVLMGISLYLVSVDKSASEDEKTVAKTVFFVQLFLNFIWSPVFFKFKMYLLAFIILILMIAAVVLMIMKFYKISKPAAYLQIPYLIWLLIAAYLNFGVYVLN